MIFNFRLKISKGHPFELYIQIIVKYHIFTNCETYGFEFVIIRVGRAAGEYVFIIFAHAIIL